MLPHHRRPAGGLPRSVPSARALACAALSGVSFAAVAVAAPVPADGAIPSLPPDGAVPSLPPDGATEVLQTSSHRADSARLVVVNKSASTLSVLDPATGTETATVFTGHAPHEVAVSPDGRLAYVTDYGTAEAPGGTITVIDVRRATVRDTISLEPHTRPHGIRVVSDGTLWVTTEGSRHVLHVDPRTGEILQAVETGQEVTHMVVVAEAAGRVYTANIGSGTVTAVDAASGEVLRHIATGAGAEGLALAPDGAHVYVTNREGGTLTEIEVATNRVSRTLEVGALPIRVAVLPAGGEALVSNARGNEVARVDLEAWAVTHRLPVGAVPVGILVTPDGETAYVANTAADRISVIDLQAWEVTGHVVAGDEPDGMAWAR